MNNINKWKNTINYLISDINDLYQDDIKQDLYMFLINFQEPSDITNIDNYIFISLRNMKFTLVRKYSNDQNLSLNKIEEQNGTICDNKNDIITELILEEQRKQLEISVRTVLTNKEMDVIMKYFYSNLTEIEIGKLNKCSQQNVSKTIKRALCKLRRELE